MTPPPPRSPLFPYTTLFRSPGSGAGGRDRMDSRTEVIRCGACSAMPPKNAAEGDCMSAHRRSRLIVLTRSEEHTSELQSHHDLVCRLLLEKKKDINQLKYFT